MFYHTNHHLRERRKNISRTFVRLLSVFIIGIFFIEAILFLYSYHSELTMLEKQIYKEDNEAIDNVVNYLETLINDEKKLNVRINDMTWKIKLSSETEVFDKDFKPTWWNLVSDDFLFYVTDGSAIDDRAVLFTGRNLVVTGDGNYRIVYYLEQEGIPNQYHVQILERISNTTGMSLIDTMDEKGNNLIKDKIMLVSPLDNSKKDYALVLISLTKLRKAIVPMLPNNFLEVKVSDGISGYQFLHWENDDNHLLKKVRRETVNIAGMNWNVEFVMNDSAMHSAEILTENQVIYLMLIIMAFCIAMLFTYYVYKPLKKIADKLPVVTGTGNIYQSIEHSVESMTSELAESRKQDALRQMLKGYFESENTEYTSDLQLRENMWMKVVVFQMADKGNDADILKMQEIFMELIGEQRVVYHLLHSLDGNVILLLGNDTRDNLEQVTTGLVKAYAEKGWKVFAGRTEYGFLGISKSYQSALEKQRFVSGIIQPGYYFPLDWENQWIVAMRQGKGNVSDEILKAVFSENRDRLARGEITKRDFYHLFQRILADIEVCTKEMGIDNEVLWIERIYREINMGMDEGGDEMKWDGLQIIESEILQIGVNVCNRAERQIDTEENVNEKIVHYVEAHFSEADLSIISMQGVFNVSAYTINKTIKLFTGKTFLPYLTQCRMERAKELLAGGMKIADVAVQVGYESEYSFRRAFQNYTGMKAQNFQQ